MRKLLIVLVAAAGVGLLARRGRAHCAGIDFGRMIERMPDNAPPKWMFRNISAIRGNTEQILDLLTDERARPTEIREPAAVA